MSVLSVLTDLHFHNVMYAHACRFLQFAVDWGRINVAQSEVRTLNERTLASGGALHRPQNKQYDLEVRILESIRVKWKGEIRLEMR